MSNLESATDPQQIMQRISDACVAVGNDGCYSFANAAAGKLAGSSPAELIGKPFGEPFPLGVDGALRRAVESALADQVPNALEIYCPSRTLV